MTINSNSIVTQPPVKIDPNFALPPGITEVVYNTDDGPEVSIDDDDEDITVTLFTDEEPTMTADVPMTELQPPLFAQIVLPQKLYVSSDGRFAVDIIMEVDDVLGATNYDVRVSKV